MESRTAIDTRYASQASNPFLLIYNDKMNVCEACEFYQLNVGVKLRRPDLMITQKDCDSCKYASD